VTHSRLPTTPSGRLASWQGRLLLRFACLVQRTVAHRRSRLDVALRNRAMRGAHRRGVGRETITRAVGLSQEQVRKALRGESTTD
jgi:hypothetical protein